MPDHGSVDLRVLLRRMAQESRTEATLQSEIHTLLLAADLNLSEDDLRAVTLESPTAGRRIDVEVGHVCIEVKKHLRPGASLDRAVTQLGAYVAERADSVGQRYTGILTDGREWRLYHLAPNGLIPASTYWIDPSNPDVSGFTAWLAGVLATEEQVSPTADAIASRLGAMSSGHQLEHADLRTLYEANRDRPEISIKRELWVKLLTSALGTQFRADDDDLFVEHTLLVVTAETIAHAVLRFPVTEIDPATLLGGELFSRRAQILGVVEHDFFDWPLECGEQGRRWVAGLARRLAQFNWSATAHDVMKTVYESVITAETRKQLGEYYTPDWLAEHMVAAMITKPLEIRVVDPACGSGTFLFHAVRRYLAAADAAGMDNAAALQGVVGHVMGIDLHPVAVTLARVTYLLAIGTTRLQTDRPPLRVPVYLGDSVQWGQRQDLFSSETLNVDTADGAEMFAEQLRFPQALLDDADRFDQLVAELAHAAAAREHGSSRPSITPIARRHGLAGRDLEIVTSTYEIMCRLHEQGRNHIWGYFVRNLARPAWLARPGNQVDMLIGNPPWLAYRFMTLHMQEQFRDMSTTRLLWVGGSVAPQQDLSDLFVARAIELFLKPGGRFSFVMPAAVLTRGQFAGFRRARWPTGESEPVGVAFNGSWDLSKLYPYFFPRTCAVVHGTRVVDSDVVPLGPEVEIWSGSIRDVRASWNRVEPQVTRAPGRVMPRGPRIKESPYGTRFTNGATIFPRVLTTVIDDTVSPVGTGTGRRAVRSFRGTYEKKPWKNLKQVEGVVEEQFLHPLALGENVLPFRLLSLAHAVLPITTAGKTVDPAEYSGLGDWWEQVSQLWNLHRSGSMSLMENLDYRRKLINQFPLPAHRVVVAHSAMHVAACRLTEQAVVEHQLDWCAVPTAEEGLYLCAVLNSQVVTDAVTPYMTSGKGGGRHIGKSLWNLPIPLFDPADAWHAELVELGRQAEKLVSTLELPDMSHGSLRRRLRSALGASPILPRIDALVKQLLGDVA